MEAVQRGRDVIQVHVEDRGAVAGEIVGARHERREVVEIVLVVLVALEHEKQGAERRGGVHAPHHDLLPAEARRHDGARHGQRGDDQHRRVGSADPELEMMGRELHGGRVQQSQHQRDEEQRREEQQLRQQPRPHAERGGVALLANLVELLVKLDPDGRGVRHARSPGWGNRRDRSRHRAA